MTLSPGQAPAQVKPDQTPALAPNGSKPEPATIPLGPKLADIRYDPWLQEAAHWFVSGESAEAANWAILDFGAVVCKVRNPECGTCSINRRSKFYGESRGKYLQSDRS